jgi:hypothetical protein
MGLLDSLVRAERRIQERIERAFGAGASDTPLELRRDILHEVEARIQPSARGRIFPYDLVQVRFAAVETGAPELLRAAFLDEESLAGDIRTLLAGAGCRNPERVEIAVEIIPCDAPASGALAPRPFEISFSVRPKTAAAPAESPARAASLEVVVGVAEQPAYRVSAERTYIGRLREIVDSTGQMVRRNDVAFLDNGEEINGSVGRAHATLHFDRARGEFRIVDDTSRYGTHIFRDNRSIAVPSGNPRGIRLRSGDEIYFGRACVRFKLE